MLTTARPTTPRVIRFWSDESVVVYVLLHEWHAGNCTMIRLLVLALPFVHDGTPTVAVFYFLSMGRTITTEESLILAIIQRTQTRQTVS